MHGAISADEEERRVLVVDDERSIVDVLSQFLARIGCVVDTATRGAAAIELAGRDHYDIIILDLKMAEMDGLTVLRELKKIDESVTVVILTAFGTVKTAVEAMKLGAEEYMLKPVQLEAFGLVIQRLFEYRRLKRENRALRESLAVPGGPGLLSRRARRFSTSST